MFAPWPFGMSQLGCFGHEFMEGTHQLSVSLVAGGHALALSAAPSPSRCMKE